MNAEIFGYDCNRKVKVIETPFVNDIQEYDNKYIENILKGKKYVLFFGALYAEKGILIISEILEKFLRENKEYFFVFYRKYMAFGRGTVCAIIKKKSWKVCR